MRFRIHRGGTSSEVDVAVTNIVIAGMTGRDMKAVQAHLDELAELGIGGPSTIPIYYRVSAGMLTTAGKIQVLGADSSGEVEAVLIGTEDGMLVAVGSDHTDRKVESYSIAVSKQMCEKPVSPDVWRYADVKDVWDELVLTAERVEGGKSHPYQKGALATVRPPEDLIGRCYAGATELPPGVAMYCGTFATIGPIVGGARFDMALTNPKTGEALRHGYDIEVIPVVA